LCRSAAEDARVVDKREDEFQSNAAENPEENRVFSRAAVRFGASFPGRSRGAIAHRRIDRSALASSNVVARHDEIVA
jgi:hypothetical protein